MKRRKLWLILSVIMLLAASVAVWQLIRANQAYFSGDRIKNPDAYLLTFAYMNADDAHTMKLEAGDRLSVAYEISKGEIDVVIGIEGEDPIYRGNRIATGDFYIEAPRTGNYTISIHAEKAQGTMNFTVNPNLPSS